ncbi:unnamed protein product [Parascedosporium putredinis]|uniref:Protein kinase domain-containing protein n=1 Tax=Parascedosporium putredinis TaxID=1442378 RepID=A0A9P1MC18_9PEZI|nr:unnamed protein product [Parascedosporium putredinis]CAI7996851.1 unnamed protein product [Parascedosporium putredinis]
MDFAACIEPLISPLAPFAGDPLEYDYVRWCQSEHDDVSRDSNTAPGPWDRSVLNPKNRVEYYGGLFQSALGRDQKCPRKPWRMDGCSALGRRFLVTPLYMESERPVKMIDVIIPCQSAQDPSIRRQLRSSDAVTATGNGALRRLGISQYVVAAVESWSLRLPYFDQIYRDISFGSSMIMETMPHNPRNAKFRFHSSLGFEDCLVASSELQDMWQLEAGAWPPLTLSIGALHLVSQLSETVVVVELPKSSGLVGRFVFKTNTRAMHRLYHELKVLLTLDPHPMILGKPRAIITTDPNAESPAGGAKVLGFIMDLVQGPTLRDALTMYQDIPLGLQLKWSVQLISALQHIMASPLQFHSDLKPDNILIDESNDERNLVLIDMEQAGNWDSFCAPEILYASRMRRLTSHELVPQEKQAAYRQLLGAIFPLPQSLPRRYLNPRHGYYLEWTSLPPNLQESAMVFAVGKLLWCIFERHSYSDQSRAELGGGSVPIESLPPQSNLEGLRELIRNCTQGSPGPETERVRITWRGSKVSAAVRDDAGAWTEVSSPRDIMLASRRFWDGQLVAMENYVMAKARWLRGSHNDDDIRLLGFASRPSLSQVLGCLENCLSKI